MVFRWLVGSSGGFGIEKKVTKEGYNIVDTLRITPLQGYPKGIDQHHYLVSRAAFMYRHMLQ